MTKGPTHKRTYLEDARWNRQVLHHKGKTYGNP